MKNEMKKLYRKDKKLSIQVAKALGFKIEGKDKALKFAKKQLSNR